LKTDVGSLKSDVGELKTDVGSLKSDVGELKTDVGSLKSDMRRIEVLHEQTDAEIKHIIEIIIPNTKQITRLREHQEEQDEEILFHERRIGFLEKKIA
jgi:chromosome segregation ATPase